MTSTETDGARSWTKAQGSPVSNVPFVSVVIPCRNEGAFIQRCLDSVLANDYPADRLEVLVVDGLSDDGTQRIVEQYARQHPVVKALTNPRKITSCGLNIGIRNAAGEVIMILGAHTVYEQDHIRKSVQYLERSPVDCVGGVCLTVPGGPGIVAQAIALALSSPFGVGNSYFRVGSAGSRFADTVPFGCYWREVFDRIGLFDEEPTRNQDDELNLRLLKGGGKLLLVPDIVSHYYGRDSLRKLWRMYFQYGYFKPLVAQKLRGILTWRQLVPAIFVTALVLSAVVSLRGGAMRLAFVLLVTMYGLANVLVSFSTGRKQGLKVSLALIPVFAVVHLSYGWGYLRGIWDFIIRKRHKRRKMADMALTR